MTLKITINVCVKLTTYPFLSAFNIVFNVNENMYWINNVSERINVSKHTYENLNSVLKYSGYAMDKITEYAMKRTPIFL